MTMEPPSSTAAAGSSRQAMAPPGFQSASSLLKTATPVPSPGTNRNASGNLPPIPKGPSASSAPISGAVSGSNGDATAGASSSAAPKAPAKPINRPAASKNAIVYNSVQRRNPLLQSIKNVGIEIGDIAADYQVGTHNGVLFLSLKYHRLHPEYIHQRIEKIRNMYTVRIMLILCDVSEHQASLRELSKIAIINQLTVFVAWSNEEVAQYLTTFKTYEHRGGDSLKEPIHQTYTEQLAHVMTSGKKVNKTDTDNLASQFGSFANISKQPSKVLSGVKGLGATKVTSLVDAFTKPFLVGGLKRGESSSQPTNPLSAAGASRVDGPGAEVPPPAKVPSPVGSPDWPDEDPEDEEAEAPVISPSIPRDRAPSRSPGLSPEAAPLDGEGEDRAGVAVWKDPLEDDEDEDDEDEGPAPKRSRLDV